MAATVSQPVVELVPWYHDVGSDLHAEVVNYIKTSPKNSSIAMEMTQNKGSYYSKIMDTIASDDKKGLVQNFSNT